MKRIKKRPFQLPVSPSGPRQIPLSALKFRADAACRRTKYNWPELQELAGSIGTTGLVEPIAVEADGDEYVVVSGERRAEAARLLGHASIAAILVAAGNVDIDLRALVANCQRKDLTPVEEARWIKRLVEKTGWSIEKLAAALGKSRPLVSQMISISTLPEEMLNEAEQRDKPVPRDSMALVASSKDPVVRDDLWIEAKSGASRKTLRAKAKKAKVTPRRRKKAEGDYVSPVTAPLELAREVATQLDDVRTKELISDDVVVLQQFHELLDQMQLRVAELIRVADAPLIDDSKIEKVKPLAGQRSKAQKSPRTVH